jgi:hypothetical protein
MTTASVRVADNPTPSTNSIMGLEKSNFISKSNRIKFGKLYNKLFATQHWFEREIIKIKMARLAVNWKQKEVLDSLGKEDCPIKDPAERFEFCFDQFLFAGDDQERKSLILTFVLEDEEVDEAQKISLLGMNGVANEMEDAGEKFGFVMERLRCGEINSETISQAFGLAHCTGEYEQLTNFLALKGISGQN